MTQRRDVLPIVADGAIGGPLLEGALVPVLILDTSERPDIAELIRVHQHLGMGDVNSIWARSPGRPDAVVLILEFQRPLSTTAIIEFSIEHQGILVESALTARAAYIQAGKPGSRLAKDFDDPRLLVELPDTGFEKDWDEIFYERMRVVARGIGLNRSEAKRAAREAIDELRTITRIRMTGGDR